MVDAGRALGHPEGAGGGGCALFASLYSGDRFQCAAEYEGIEDDDDDYGEEAHENGEKYEIWGCEEDEPAYSAVVSVAVPAH